ncbi:MAG: hypothetical protein ACD_78C00151G0001, partial [uncultured bacterium (gcode 4)]
MVEYCIDHICMNKYPVLNSARRVKFIIECRCCRADKDNLIFYKIRIILSVIDVHKRNFLKLRSIREIIYENISRIIGRIWNLYAHESSFKWIYRSSEFERSDILRRIQIKIFLKNLKWKSLISLFLGYYAVYGRIVGIYFR